MAKQKRAQGATSGFSAPALTQPATFDPLDAPIFDAYKYHQALPDSVRSSLYIRWYWADPQHWIRHKPPAWVFALKWSSFRYCEVQDRQALKLHLLKDDPGVYFFTVRPIELMDEHFPHHVFYVGISNEADSGRALRDRLGDYLPNSLSAIKKRKNVHKFLTLYYEQTWVRFAYVQRASSEIEEAEVKLHGYLAPPVAERDYPPDMKSKKPAF